jgi:hydrogenase nickel incorporation protein HypA/HybF
MHELSIACSLVKAAVDEAVLHRAVHVLNVDVALGALSGVEMDSLMFCFPAVAKGTLCEGALLQVEIVPATGRCPACLTTCAVRDFMTACPDCGSWPLGIQGGRDMTLRAVEIE